MSDPSLWWWHELDGAQPARVKCAGCDLYVLAETLSPSGHCELCVQRGRDDAKAMRAEAMRRP